eukprot:scaffold2869_cov69-Phaeocystis_antarctica.AAC.1
MLTLCIAACARADVRRSSAVSGWVRSEHVGKQRLAGRRHAKSPDGSSLCSGGAPSSRSSRQHATKSSITALPSNASSSTASSGTPVAAPTLRAAPPPEAGPKGRTRQVPATPPASCARPPRRRKTSPRPWTGHGPDPSSRRRTCVAGLREQGHRRVDRAAGRAWLGLQGPRPHDSSRWRRTAAAKASGPTARGWSFARSAAATSATSEGGGAETRPAPASGRGSSSSHLPAQVEVLHLARTARREAHHRHRAAPLHETDAMRPLVRAAQVEHQRCGRVRRGQHQRLAELASLGYSLPSRGAPPRRPPRRRHEATPKEVEATASLHPVLCTLAAAAARAPPHPRPGAEQLCRRQLCWQRVDCGTHLRLQACTRGAAGWHQQGCRVAWVGLQGGMGGVAGPLSAARTHHCTRALRG